jgi:hypothetical protein
MQTLRVDDASKELTFRLEKTTPVTLAVQVPRGVSYVLLKTDPPATSDDDAIVLWGVRVEPTSDAAQLTAVETSPDPGF